MPAAVRRTLEALPAAAHPMDVIGSGVSALGCVLPETHDHNPPGARDIADRLMASLGSILLYWHHFAHNGRRIEVETNDESIGAHSCICCTAGRPAAAHLRAMHTSLILYAEHEFNASTFTARSIAGTGADMYSAITGAIGALRGPKHGGANEVAFEIQKRYGDADEAEADIRRRIAAKEVVIGFGHPVYTVADPRNQVIKEVARTCRTKAEHAEMFDIAERIEAVMAETRRCSPISTGSARSPTTRWGCRQRCSRRSSSSPAPRAGRSRHRAASGQQDHPPLGQLCRPGKPLFVPLEERGRRRTRNAARRLRNENAYLVGCRPRPIRPGERFRELVKQPGILQIPGRTTAWRRCRPRPPGSRRCTCRARR